MASEENISRWTTVSGALLGGIAASVCCVLPMIFLWVGVSGAWIANLTALSAYHLVFVCFATVLLAASYYFIYVRNSGECEEGEACAQPLPSALVKTSFWIAAALICIAAIFPYAVSFYYGE